MSPVRQHAILIPKIACTPRLLHSGSHKQPRPPSRSHNRYGAGCTAQCPIPGCFCRMGDSFRDSNTVAPPLSNHWPLCAGWRQCIPCDEPSSSAGVNVTSDDPSTSSSSCAVTADSAPVSMASCPAPTSISTLTGTPTGPGTPALEPNPAPAPTPADASAASVSMNVPSLISGACPLDPHRNHLRPSPPLSLSVQGTPHPRSAIFTTPRLTACALLLCTNRVAVAHRNQCRVPATRVQVCKCGDGYECMAARVLCFRLHAAPAPCHTPAASGSRCSLSMPPQSSLPRHVLQVSNLLRMPLWKR